MTTTDSDIRADFFRLLFGGYIGYLCLATESAAKGDFKQHWFAWPNNEAQLLRFIAQQNAEGKNVWFCVNLFSKKERKKEFALEGKLVWADLDFCLPSEIQPTPQVVIESSPERYQALWLLDQTVDPYVAEDYSRRIYTQYKNNGVDSGWALTKLLRVPLTYNYKYPDKPLVKLIKAIDFAAPTELFDEIAQAVEIEEPDREPEPARILEPESLIKRHEISLRRHGFFELWTYEPEEDESWSEKLWRLELICFEAGLSREEVFALAYHSNFNKYKRDGRPSRYLWAEVLKAEAKVRHLEVVIDANPITMPDLIPGDDFKFEKTTLVEDYVAWGKLATDASPVYHELSAFILLSAILAGNLKLETSYGTVIPNLWGLILGDSTLTRKSTAMRMATDIIDFVDRDILLATDGSAEGILTGLSGRPRRTSVFFRDEVVGLFDAIRKKDYLAGISQLFTQLYDGGYIARRLRKELITVTDPVFIFFGGGIQDQFYTAVDEQFIYSGFLPRFLIVCGQTELESLRRIGPPTEETQTKRKEIYEKMHDLYRRYAVVGEVEILGQAALAPLEVEVLMTEEAWSLHGDIAERLTVAAYESKNPGVALPTFERLSTSLLKMAILIAASRQKPQDGKVEATAEDIRRAASYVQRWGEYTVEVIQNVGQTIGMRLMERVLSYIRKHPEVNRSTVMQVMNLDKRQMTAIEETLEARNEIRINIQGRGRTYSPIT